MKINLKAKHHKLGVHFTRFVDRRWFPDFVLDTENLHTFIKFESYGRSYLTVEESKLIEPLINAKINKELTIKMLIEECAEWWSHGNGWIYPMIYTIRIEFENRKSDKLLLIALIKIMRDIKKNGFLTVLTNFTGLSDDEKDKYISRYINQIEIYTKL